MGDARLELSDAGSNTTRVPAANVSAAGVRTARSSSARAWPFVAGALAVSTMVVAGLYISARRAPGPASHDVVRFVIYPPPGTTLISGHREVAIAPDGSTVAFIARDATTQRVYVRSLDELESHAVEGTDGARDVAFSPDGLAIAFHDGARLKRVGLGGGASPTLAEALHTHGIAWNPRDNMIYYAPTAASALWKVAAGGGSPA